MGIVASYGKKGDPIVISLVGPTGDTRKVILKENWNKKRRPPISSLVGYTKKYRYKYRDANYWYGRFNRIIFDGDLEIILSDLEEKWDDFSDKISPLDHTKNLLSLYITSIRKTYKIGDVEGTYRYIKTMKDELMNVPVNEDVEGSIMFLYGFKYIVLHLEETAQTIQHIVREFREQEGELGKIYTVPETKFE